MKTKTKTKNNYMYTITPLNFGNIISVIHICYICISRQRKYKQNMPDIEEDILEYLTFFNSQKKNPKILDLAYFEKIT